MYQMMYGWIEHQFCCNFISIDEQIWGNLLLLGGLLVGGSFGSGLYKTIQRCSLIVVTKTRS
jgi:hypothetical protein